VTLTFDLLTPKSIGVFCSIRAITLWSLKALGQRVLELLSGNGFHSSGHYDLDLWPTDPKINRGLLLNKGYHPMKFEGSGLKGTQVIERKRSVTDGQTARRTDGQTDRAKTICLPQRGGRHNKWNKDIIFKRQNKGHTKHNLQLWKSIWIQITIYVWLHNIHINLYLLSSLKRRLNTCKLQFQRIMIIELDSTFNMYLLV